MGDGVAQTLIGTSTMVQSLMNLITQVAVSDSTILITGESGVGKELVANNIHRASARTKAPFVIIDCAALQESLLESELFGHERGAYTGAVSSKKGLFEVAHQGTVFLDEVGEISPAIQAKLLRVLETGTFRRLGSTQNNHVNVRVLAATNRNLEHCVTKGHFRQDLFFRLNVVPIHVPPLRERREDIPLLAQHFLHFFQKSVAHKKEFSSEAMKCLKYYSWPGNIRELKNLIERAVLLSTESQISSCDLPESLLVKSKMVFDKKGDTWLSLREAEGYYIAQVLEHVNGHREQAASILGISRRHLHRKILQYDLK